MRIVSRLRTVCAAVAIASAAAACGGSTDGGATPASVVIGGSDPVTLTALNQTLQLGAQVLDVNGSPIAGAGVTWARTSGFSVTVTPGGLVTAVLAGSSVVTATSGALSDNVTVTVTQAPFSMTKTGGDNQNGLTSAALGTLVRVRVSDALGSAIPSVSVNFAAGNGGSAAPPTDPTDNSGEAQTTWTLGAGAGAQALTATVPGTALTATFGATASAPGQPTAITAFAGTGQTALVGFAANVRPAVRVVDATTAPVQGVAVTFTVTGGGGSGNQVVNTDANGVAQMTNWIMGVGAGPNTLSASIAAAGVTGNPVAFTATAQTAQYNIEIRNIGPAFSAPVQAAFNNAETYWQSAIYGDQSDIPGFNVSADACFTGQPAMNETVDDLIIHARIDTIDGPGQILGQASTCFVRTSNGLALTGVMSFDSADMSGLVASGQLNGVILHEMGHVLGFSPSTFTRTNNARVCLQLPSSGPAGAVNSQDTHFNCTVGGGNLSGAIFDSIGGTSYTGGNAVPLENCAALVPPSCGPGNYNAHWREASFFNELMTPFLNNGIANPLSVVSLAVFSDLGYLVNLSVAEVYSRVFTAPGVGGRGGLLDLGNDLMRVPIGVVDDRTGRVLQVIRP